MSSIGVKQLSVRGERRGGFGRALDSWGRSRLARPSRTRDPKLDPGSVCGKRECEERVALHEELGLAPRFLPLSRAGEGLAVHTQYRTFRTHAMLHPSLPSRCRVVPRRNRYPEPSRPASAELRSALSERRVI